MNNPVVDFFETVNPWLQEEGQKSTAWNLQGVNEKTFRRWRSGDAPTGEAVVGVVEKLWQKIQAPQNKELKQRVLKTMQDMDLNAPKADADQECFTKYWNDVAERCRSRVELEILVKRGKEKSFHVVTEAGVAPVPSGARVCVRVRATHPVFLHLMWIDSQGGVTPLYPWRPDHWDQIQPHSPMAFLNLPADRPDWEINTLAGMETCVVMVSVFQVPDANLSHLKLSLYSLHTPKNFAHLPNVAKFSSEKGKASQERLNVAPHISEKEMFEWRHRELTSRLLAASFDRVVGLSFANSGGNGKKA
jgi:hypothetical protein